MTSMLSSNKVLPCIMNENVAAIPKPFLILSFVILDSKSKFVTDQRFPRRSVILKSKARGQNKKPTLNASKTLLTHPKKVYEVLLKRKNIAVFYIHFNSTFKPI